MAYICENINDIKLYLKEYMNNEEFSTNSDDFKNKLDEFSKNLLSENNKNMHFFISKQCINSGILCVHYKEDRSYECLIIADSERSIRDLLLKLPENEYVRCYFNNKLFTTIVKEYVCSEFIEENENVVEGYKRSEVNSIIKYSPTSKNYVINSKKDPVVYDFKQCVSLSGRIKNEKFVIEGMLLVKRALLDGQLIEKVVYSGNEDDEELKQVIEICSKRKIMCHKVSAGIIGSMTTTHPIPDIMCIVRNKLYNQKELLLSSKRNFYLILDGISNPDNLGIILRTLDASGVSGLILLSNSVHFMNKNAIRGARGAIGRIPIYVSEDDNELFEKLKSEQFKIIGTSVKFGSHSFYDIDYKFKNIAMVIGNESFGVRKEILDLCNEYTKIPMVDGQSSLNIAVASALIMYEYSRNYRDY